MLCPFNPKGKILLYIWDRIDRVSPRLILDVAGKKKMLNLSGFEC
jgi:hypothetical protein